MNFNGITHIHQLTSFHTITLGRFTTTGINISQQASISHYNNHQYFITTTISVSLQQPSISHNHQYLSLQQPPILAAAAATTSLNENVIMKIN